MLFQDWEPIRKQRSTLNLEITTIFSSVEPECEEGLLDLLETKRDESY